MCGMCGFVGVGVGGRVWLCEKVEHGFWRRSPIAQLVERVAVNRKVAGSSPAGRDRSFLLHTQHHL